MYTEMNKTGVYKHPYYSPEHQQRIEPEALKFIMRSNEDWMKTSTLVRHYGRTPVQVTYCWKISENDVINIL